MFCGLRFKFVFYQIFWIFWGHSRHHLAHILRKKPFRKSLQKRGAPLLEIWPLSACPMAPRDAASRARFSTVTIARARIIVRIRTRARVVARIRVQVCVDCNSKSGNCSKMAAWVGFDCKSFENNSKKWKGWYQINLLLMIWHATGQKPGELVYW